MAGHIVLLGDSIFDNGAYVAGGPDVATQLKARLPDGCDVTLLAVDGAVTADVAPQLARVPADATLLVVSAGGNDALGESHLLDRPAESVAEALTMLQQVRSGFADDYRVMLDAVAGVAVPTAVCTIYDANFPGLEGEVITAALSLFNDAITRAAFARGFGLVDLRLICSEPEDYANPIEPSELGGDKIAAAIARLAGDLPGAAGHSLVVASAGSA